jgi:hypothetical protein
MEVEELAAEIDRVLEGVSLSSFGLAKRLLPFIEGALDDSYYRGRDDGFDQGGVYGGED